jgi:light-regulated signal transduction histidine kinase (bacteriophytochrome)
MDANPEVKHTLIHQYDSEFCGSIPLNLINLIQPHGVLLVLNKETLQVAQVSENIGEKTGILPEKMLNSTIFDFMPENQATELRKKIDRWGIRDRIPMDITLNTPRGDVRYVASVHPKNKYVLLELEEVVQVAEESFMTAYQEVKYITAALKEASDVEAICRIAALEIRQLSGFDRVMIYHFDDLWNGTVLAEAREENLEPYIGLRFPASDVPRQTRELYYRNPYRLIPDREFVPVRLKPVVNPITRAFTDLSESTLRGVPNVHVEYLRNMQVMASMSTPIIIDNRLWGLISCHHKTPRHPDFAMRSSFELLAGILAGQIMAKEREKSLLFRSRLQDIQARLVRDMFGQTNFVAGLIEHGDALLELFDIRGAAIVWEGNVQTTGITPSVSQIQNLVHWLQLSQQGFAIFASNQMPLIFTESELYPERGSGLLAIPLEPRRGVYLMGFRPEVIQTVDWGGNPNEAIRFEADGRSYHPRNSFAIWQETVRLHSEPWQPEVLEAAESLRTLVLERLLNERE